MPRWNIFSGIIELLLLRVIHSSSDELQKPKVSVEANINIIITIMIAIIFFAKVIIIISTFVIIVTSSPRCAWRRRRRRKRRREFLRHSPQHGRLYMLDMS